MWPKQELRCEGHAADRGCGGLEVVTIQQRSGFLKVEGERVVFQEWINPLLLLFYSRRAKELNASVLLTNLNYLGLTVVVLGPSI